MFDFITRELGGRGIGALAAFLLGGLVSWALGVRTAFEALSSESGPLSGEFAPGLFLPLDASDDLGDSGPALADRSSAASSAWDAALAEAFGEDAWSPPTGPLSSPTFEGPDLAQLSAAPGSAALAGLVVALWGTREYRLRRSDRRRTFALSPSRQ